ncbi:MAG: tyrosine-protein phosphatase [Natronospirillum sp.]
MMGYRQWRTSWSHRFNVKIIRFTAWLDATLIDHGFLRIFWNRPKPFTEHAWRSNQPSPRQVRWLLKNGIKTIVNLRGVHSGGAYLFEEEACKAVGLELVSFKMTSRGAPSREKIIAFGELLENVKKPVLFHCKSGADRAGFAAALYLLLTGEGSITDAKEQLSWRYLHFKGAKTGLLDAFLVDYETFASHTPIEFLTWVKQHYNPNHLKQNFKPSGFSSWVVDKVLRRE